MGRDLVEFSRRTVEEVKNAWELFVTGDDKYVEKVRPEIRASWQRSRQAQVNPKARQIPFVLTPDQLDRRYQQNTLLLEAGQEIITLLDQGFTAKTFVAMIADSEGIILYTYAPPDRDKREEINALPGAGTQEGLIGTSSSSLALYLNRPASVYWYEHYVEFGCSWAECAAPIHSSYGDGLGLLTISGYEEGIHPSALNLVTSATRWIEERIRHPEELSRLKLLEEFNRSLLKFPDSLLLAVNPHGRILSLSPALAKLITLQPPDHVIGKCLPSIRDFHCEGLRLPLADFAAEPYESTIVLPLQEKARAGTVIPIFREGHPAGLVVIASGLSQPTSKKVVKPSWQATYTFHDLVGRTPAFGHAVQAAEKAAEYSWPVLLVGESGTGKELFAQAIHRASRHTGGPFVAINCSAIPKELAASELFGYEDGAFSGALRGGQPGKIELAHRGTLFLDEIADMPAEIQASLLRVLEEGKVVPLGSKRPREVDVRIIAALNTDPQAAVAQGKLRLDLYHRLNVFPIVIPPLRERVEDLPLLARHLLDREGFAGIEVAPEVFEVFRNHAWPGNIRELRNVLVRAALLASDQMLTPKHLPPELSRHSAAPLLPVSSARRETGEQLHSPSRQVDQAQLQQAFKACGGNIAHAAKRLGIHKATFYRKLQQYGLTREDL
jgi:transcriptional regulator of acetoin/glycerol metabolism